MPESVTDRPTKAHEYIFLLTKSARYWYDESAIREPGGRSEWSTQKYKGGDKTRHHGSSIGPEPIDYSTGRNARTVWTIPTQPYPEAHFATFPEEIPRRCIRAGCPKFICADCRVGVRSRVPNLPGTASFGGTVLDPFAGSGTTVAVAIQEGREGVGIELNPEYARLATERIQRSETGVTEKEQRSGQMSLIETETEKREVTR